MMSTWMMYLEPKPCHQMKGRTHACQAVLQNHVHHALHRHQSTKKVNALFLFFFSFFPCVNELLYLTVFVLFLLYSRLPDLEDFTLISHYLCSNAVLVIMVVEFDQRPGGLCKEAERVGIVGPCRNLIVAFEYLKRGYEKARERSSSGIVVVWWGLKALNFISDTEVWRFRYW